MQPEVFALCDAATESQGKLNLLGAFDTIFAKSLPAVQLTCAIVARVRFLPSEIGEHSFRVLLRDPADKDLVPPFQGTLNVVFDEPDKPARFNLIIGLAGLKFEAYGPHRAELQFDGKRLAEMPFHVSMPRQAPTPAAG